MNEKNTSTVKSKYHMLVLLICEVIPYNEVFHAET